MTAARAASPPRLRYRSARDFVSWAYDDDATGWGTLLGDAIGAPEVSPYGAPGRLDDFSQLLRADIELGKLDIFSDECLATRSGWLPQE